MAAWRQGSGTRRCNAAARDHAATVRRRRLTGTSVGDSKSCSTSPAEEDDEPEDRSSDAMAGVSDGVVEEEFFTWEKSWAALMPVFCRLCMLND